MSTPDLKIKIAQLQKEVQQYGNVQVNGSSSSSLFTANKLYVAVPVIILILFIVIRPNFVYVENSEGQRSLSWKKIFIFWAIISFILVAGLYGFMNRN